jgi:hypothetical protein
MSTVRVGRQSHAQWKSGAMDEIRQTTDNGITRAFIDSDGVRIDNPVLQFFLDYWSRVRGVRGMPARSDIRPNDIKAHIGSIVIAEAIGDFDDFRFKLIGTDVSQYFLADGTGKTVREAYAGSQDQFGECVLENYRETARRQRPLLASIANIRWTNNLRFRMESIYLPLSEDAKSTNSVLTAFTYRFRSEQKKLRSN